MKISCPKCRGYGSIVKYDPGIYEDGGDASSATEKPCHLCKSKGYLEDVYLWKETYQ